MSYSEAIELMGGGMKKKIGFRLPAYDLDFTATIEEDEQTGEWYEVEIKTTGNLLRFLSQTMVLGEYRQITDAIDIALREQYRHSGKE